MLGYSANRWYKYEHEKTKVIDNLVSKFYHNVAPLLLGEACLYTVVGVLMLMKPMAVLNMFAFVIGLGLILFGLYRVSMVFVSNIGAGVGFFDVFVGLMTLVLGLVFCIFPGGAAISLIYAFMVLFLVNAHRMLAFANLPRDDGPQRDSMGSRVKHGMTYYSLTTLSLFT